MAISQISIPDIVNTLDSSRLRADTLLTRRAFGGHDDACLAGDRDRHDDEQAHEFGLHVGKWFVTTRVVSDYKSG